jgi:hypothetical protein
MAIFEPEDFYKIWDPQWMKFNSSVDKLKKMRLKIAHDDKKKEEGIPTSIELQNWFDKPW